MKNALIIIACALVAVVGIGALALSRSERGAAEVETGPVSVLPEAVEESAGAPLDVGEEEGTAFASRWEAAMAAGDQKAVVEMVDLEAFHARAFSDLPLDRGWKKALAGTFEEIFGGLAGATEEQVASGGGYTFVHLLRRGDARHALFRLETVDGFNYHDLRLRKDADGVTCDQFFIAITGQELADQMRSQIVPAILADAKLSSKLSGEARRELRWLIDMNSMSAAFREGDHARTCEEYDRLPPEVQVRKHPAFMNVTASAQVDEARYLEALERYRELFPGDPAIEFLSLDAAFITEDSEALARCGAAISRWTGGDPWIDSFIADARAAIDEGD